MDSEDEIKLDQYGQVIQYISLMQARVLAIRHARENPDIYPERYSGVDLVWELLSADDLDEDYY